MQSASVAKLSVSLCLVGDPPTLGGMPTLQQLMATPLPVSSQAADPAASPPGSGAALTPTAGPVAPAGETEAAKTPKEGKAGAQHTSFVLGEGFPIIPGKLVQKIQKGEFVDMSEMLQDNIQLEKKAPGSETSKQHKKRELSEDSNGLLSWVECFVTYSQILLAKHPEKAQDLAAYLALVVREARRFNFRGWLQYDHLLRQHTAKDPAAVEWEKINSALYAITFLSRQRGETQTCTWCMGSDHPTSQCALQKHEPVSYSREYPRKTTPNRPYTPPVNVRSGRRTGSVNSGTTRLCYSWNDGRCVRGAHCQFRHACYRCEGDHRAIECPIKVPRPDGLTAPDGPSGSSNK